jgi:ABC-type branched-subunit amino acid transport system substrate-binding protein
LQKKILILLFASLPFIAVLSIVFFGSQRSLEEERIHNLATLPLDSPITFGVLWSANQGGDSFNRGVELAIEEINQTGGLLGRKIDTKYSKIKSGYMSNMNIIYGMNEHRSLCFLLGFPLFKTTLLHLGLTRYYGIPSMLNSQDTNLLLKKWTQDLTVRGNSSSKAIAKKIAGKCKSLGLDNVLILRKTYEYDYFFEELANYTTNYLLIADIKVDSYVMDSLDKITDKPLAIERFNYIKEENKDLKLGAVVLSANQNDILDLTNFLMDNTMIESAISFVDFSVVNPVQSAQKISELKKPLYIVTDYLEEKELRKERLKFFVEKYFDKFKNPPNNWSLNGYDQTLLVAQAIKNGNSFLPYNIITELKKMQYAGICQEYSFTRTGELEEPSINFFYANELPLYIDNITEIAESIGISKHLVKGFFHDFTTTEP